MQTQNNTIEKEFQAVEYMRTARTELTEKFLQNRQEYLDYLKNAMADFKRRQSSAKGQS